METVLLTHQQWITVLQTNSYDDDDILTETLRGHSQLHRVAGLGPEYLLWGFVKGNLDRVDDACRHLG